MLYNKYIKYKEKYILQKKGGSISSSNKSLFVLSCGPTGSTDSGKSNVKKIFECIYNKKFNEILVDDLVENDPLYLSIISTINLHYDLDSIIEKLNQIKLVLEDNPSLIKNYEKIFIELKKNEYYCNTLLNNEDDKNECDKINYIKKIIDEYTNAYFYTRKNGCIYDNTYELYKQLFPEYDCNKLNDSKLYEALFKKNNIVLESTCNSDISWLFTLFQNKYMNDNYELHIVFVFLNKNELIQRIINRYTNSKKRLPNFLNVINIYEDIYKKFIELKNTDNKNFILHLLDTNNLSNIIHYDNIDKSTNIDLFKITDID